MQHNKPPGSGTPNHHRHPPPKYSPQSGGNDDYYEGPDQMQYQQGNVYPQHYQMGSPPYAVQVQNPLYVDTGSGSGAPPPPRHIPQHHHNQRRKYNPNEVDPGMNGDGWQAGGGRGGQYNNGGNRRGGGGGGNQYNQRMPQNQHHGGMNRMMTPSFRPQQQQQYMPPYAPMGGMPDVMDMNMRMDSMSLGSTPTMPGQYGDMGVPQQQQWNQPAPFAAPPPQQDDLYDPTGGYGGHHQQMPYGQQQRGGQQNQYGNRMQGGGGNRGYQPRNQNYNMNPMMPPPNQGYYGGNQNHQQPPYAPSPFSMSGSQTPIDHHMGGGHQGNGNFGGGASSMDDYSMWTDENDEEAKRKKTLRDKGLLAWGDADVSNSKPISKWLVPEGADEDFETAMERCPAHLKKKALNEETLRRRLGSENPQVVAQAQQQAEEEASATMKVGKRPIVPTGWGDGPNDLIGEKSEYDQGSSKGGWGDDSSLSGGRHHAQQHHQQQHNDDSLWNNPSAGGPSSSETRNPFFAQHMQQQHHQQQQQHQQHYSQGVYENSGVLDGGSVWGAVMDGSPMGPPMGGGGPSSTSTSMPMGMLMMSSSTTLGGSSSGGDEDQRAQLAENLQLAVDKGHLDRSLLSLPHIPSNVLDLLTEILSVIPRLDSYEDDLKKLQESRPSNSDESSKDEQDTTWMNKDQKSEHDKAMIGVVTSKIEVTQLSRKITEALVEAGILPQQILHNLNNQSSHHHGPPGGGPPGGPDGGGAGGGQGGPNSSRGGDSFNNSGGAPNDFYDYSFLG